MPARHRGRVLACSSRYYAKLINLSRGRYVYVSFLTRPIFSRFQERGPRSYTINYPHNAWRIRFFCNADPRKPLARACCGYPRHRTSTLNGNVLIIRARSARQKPSTGPAPSRRTAALYIRHGQRKILIPAVVGAVAREEGAFECYVSDARTPFTTKSDDIYWRAAKERLEQYATLRLYLRMYIRRGI